MKTKQVGKAQLRCESKAKVSCIKRVRKKFEKKINQSTDQLIMMQKIYTVWKLLEANEEKWMTKVF